MPTRRNLLAAAPLLALPRIVHAAESAPLVGRIALEGHRLFTSARINGEKLLFIVDTGTTQNLIRPEIAARLKLEHFGGGQIGGLGRKTGTVGLHVARNVVVGDIVRQPLMTFQSYNFGPGWRPDAAGLLAAGTFTRYATTLDFVKGEWSLHLKGLPPLEGYRAWPARINRIDSDQSERIFVDANFDGVPLRLMLDTGSPRHLMLMPQTVARLKLFEGNRAYKETRVSGFGGDARYPARAMRAGALQVGAYRFDDLPYVAMDPREERKGFAADGIIGMDLIALFDLAIDPRSDRVLVRRNSLPYIND